MFSYNYLVFYMIILFTYTRQLMGAITKPCPKKLKIKKNKNKEEALIEEKARGNGRDQEDDD